MHSPSSDLAPAGNHTLVLGTSPGIRDVHDPSQLPLDTVTYLLRAEAERGSLDARGLFFAVDSRLDGDTSDHAAVRERTDRLRTLLAAVVPQFSMTTHTDLLQSEFDHTLSRVPPDPAIPHEGLRHYARLQTAQVLHMRSQACPADADRFTKFGWILARRSGKPVGGEANFDEVLPADAGVDFRYTAPGFPLNSLDGKAPYLLSASDRENRICIPDCSCGIGPEVRKVQAGIPRVVAETLRATGETLLGIRPRIHASGDDLAALPVSKPMKERIQDSAALEDLRALLAASLQKLLP